MKVTLDLERNTCAVEKEAGDKRFTSGSWSLAESVFLYQVLKALKAQGFDVIKKRMWKDGCLMDDTQQWIRTRDYSDKNPNGFAIYNGSYSIYDAGLEFNSLKVGDSIHLTVNR